MARSGYRIPYSLCRTEETQKEKKFQRILTGFIFIKANKFDLVLASHRSAWGVHHSPEYRKEEAPKITSCGRTPVGSGPRFSHDLAREWCLAGKGTVHKEFGLHIPVQVKASSMRGWLLVGKVAGKK